MFYHNFVGYVLTTSLSNHIFVMCMKYIEQCVHACSNMGVPDLGLASEEAI